MLKVYISLIKLDQIIFKINIFNEKYNFEKPTS